jgi:hypothetical protein
MVNSYIQNLWFFLAIIILIITCVIVVKFSRKSGMSKTFILTMGILSFDLFLTLYVFWDSPTDISTIIFCICGQLIFALIFVLASKVNQNLFQDFNIYKNNSTQNFLMKVQKKRGSNLNKVEEKKDSDRS